MPVTLGYWNIRGASTRNDVIYTYREARHNVGWYMILGYLLKYTNTEFEDVRYTSQGPPDYSREEWLSVKFTLGLDFPNLPYLIDGDVKITQTNAIMAYIARKNDLAGKTEAEMATVDMLANVVMDFRNGFVRLCYNPNMESMKEEYIKNVRATIQKFSDHLGEKEWLTGSQITYPDFHLYEMLAHHKAMEPSLLEGLDNLKAYMERFENLPAIKEYMASSEFIKDRYNNPIARWK